ncbi:MAG: hypothetical protein ABIV11_03535 [Gemmatimonadaceae bacterium]
MVAFLLAACGGQEGDAGQRAPSAADTISLTQQDSAEMNRIARDVVAFLSGAENDFLQRDLADTVMLYVSPEGGGARAAFHRDDLRHPSSWKITSGKRSQAFAPPPGNRKLTTKVGRHFNCREYELSSRYPDLSRLPHVGTKLEPENPASCLQTWNLTLVFDSAQQPRLVAAVYDQWEW